MIVTTTIKVTEAIQQQAMQYAKQFQCEFIPRAKLTVQQLLQIDAEVFVVYRQELRYYQGETYLKYHPSAAYLRILAPKDPLLDLLGAEVTTVLDTTMGMASDSLVMSYAGYQVTAIESNPVIYEIVSQGLQQFVTESAEVNQAMRRIQTVQADSLAYLQSLPEDSVDVIYLDPMFSETIAASKNLDGIRSLANYARVSEAFIQEAKRVARVKVILKAHFRDDVFERYGFERQIRKNTKFHFGVIKLKV